MKRQSDPGMNGGRPVRGVVVSSSECERLGFSQSWGCRAWALKTSHVLNVQVWVSHAFVVYHMIVFTCKKHVGCGILFSEIEGF